MHDGDISEEMEAAPVCFISFPIPSETVIFTFAVSLVQTGTRINLLLLRSNREHATIEFIVSPLAIWLLGSNRSTDFQDIYSF